MTAKNFEFPGKTWPQIPSDIYKNGNDIPVHLRDLYCLQVSATLWFLCYK